MKTCFNHNFSKSTATQILKKPSAAAISINYNTHAETAEINQKTLILIIFSGAENGARPTTLQNKPKTVISIIFSYSKNEKYSIFKFQTHRWGTGSFQPAFPGEDRILKT